MLPYRSRQPLPLRNGGSSRRRADIPQQHITETLRQCYTSNHNGIHEMIAGLNEGEKGILRTVLTLE